MSTATTPADEFTIREHRVESGSSGVVVRDYLPKSPTARTPFLWVHGGGFTSGGLDQKESDAPARQLAAAGVRVRTLDYRLAPKANPFKDPDLSPDPGRHPAGLDDVLSAATTLADETGGPINLGGASAGADLAAGAVLRLRDAGAVLPRAVVLAYARLHAVLPPDEQIEKELRGVLAKWAFNPAMLRRMNLNYVGDPELLAPGYAFPGGADIHDFPSTLILDASNDRLRRSGHAFAAELRAIGTEVREVVIASTHGFLNQPKSGRYAEGMREISAWLQSHDD